MFFYIIVILINILILSVIYIFLSRRIERLTDTGKITKEIAGELDLILAEINQATDRNVMIIEDKINELDKAIEKAEHRISLLKKGEAVSPPGAAEIKKTELTYSHLSRMSSMSGMVTPLKVEEKKADEVDERQRVIDLYRSGLDASLIAAGTGLNIGEIELIISLYREKESRQD